MAHRSDRVRQHAPRPFWEQPDRLTYEAAILARSPHLHHVVAPVVDEKGGQR